MLGVKEGRKGAREEIRVIVDVAMRTTKKNFVKYAAKRSMRIL